MIRAKDGIILNDERVNKIIGRILEAYKVNTSSVKITLDIYLKLICLILLNWLSRHAFVYLR